MLMLRRKVDEEIVLTGDIRIRICWIGRRTVSVGIEAPEHIKIDRAEFVDQPAMKGVNREACPVQVQDRQQG